MERMVATGSSFSCSFLSQRAPRITRLLRISVRSAFGGSSRSFWTRQDAKEPELDLSADRPLRVRPGFRLSRLQAGRVQLQVLGCAGTARRRGTLRRQLELHVDHIREGRTPDAILYEILLKSGYPLDHAGRSPLRSQARPRYSVAARRPVPDLSGAGADHGVDPRHGGSEARAGGLPGCGLCRNDQLKANAVQIFKTKGVTSFKTV